MFSGTNNNMSTMNQGGFNNAQPTILPMAQTQTTSTTIQQQAPLNHGINQGALNNSGGLSKKAQAQLKRADKEYAKAEKGYQKGNIRRAEKHENRGMARELDAEGLMVGSRHGHNEATRVAMLANASQTNSLLAAQPTVIPVAQTTSYSQTSQLGQQGLMRQQGLGQQGLMGQQGLGQQGLQSGYSGQQGFVGQQQGFNSGLQRM